MSDLLKQVDQPLDDSTRLIPLTQGKFAIVDAADYEWLNQWKWTARKAKNGRYYAGRYPWSAQDKKYATVLMHRQIMLFPSCDVDHKDRDGLNNTRGNLRLATNSQNGANRIWHKNNTSGYKGVVRESPKSNKWRAQITVNGKTLNLGAHVNRSDAARVYNEAAILYFGEFAVLNDI